MSNKTNEEKLRILQERLATIKKNKEKKEEANQKKGKGKKKVAPVFKEELVNKPKIDPISPSPKKKTGDSLKYLIITVAIVVVGYGAYKMSWQFVHAYLHSSNNEEEIIITNKEETITNEEVIINNEEVVYNKSIFDVDGGFIIVINSHKEESIANTEARTYIDIMNNWNDATKTCGVYPLPGISDSKEPVFQTIISTFETKSEAKNMVEFLLLDGKKGEIKELQ